MNLALFRIRMFTFGVVSLLLVATATSMATFVLLPFYLQDVLRPYHRRSWGWSSWRLRLHHRLRERERALDRRTDQDRACRRRSACS